MAEKRTEKTTRREQRNSASRTEFFRLRSYSILTLLAIPIMAVTAVSNLKQGNILIVLLILFSGSGLTCGWLLVRRDRYTKLVYNLNAFLFVAVLVYALALGGEHGSKSLWFYTFPMICHFMLGKNNGLFWNGVATVLMLLVFYLPAGDLVTYDYDPAYKLRFFASYLIISLFSFWFETMISHYQQDIRRQNEKLQSALSEVKALQGLLPICSYCHKIRNEEGAWDRLEEYIQRNSDAQFTHGICPDCKDANFPEFAHEKTVESG